MARIGPRRGWRIAGVVALALAALAVASAALLVLAVASDVAAVATVAAAVVPDAAPPTKGEVAACAA